MKFNAKIQMLTILSVLAGLCLIMDINSPDVAWSADQSSIRHPASAPPPHMAAHAKMIQEQEKIPKPLARPTKQQLEAIIAKQDKGVEKINAAKSKRAPSQVLKPNQSPPQHEIERVKLEKMQKDADQLKSSKPGRVSQYWQALLNIAVWLNPFHVQDAFAQTTPLSRDYKIKRPATMQANNPNLFDLYSPTPYGYVSFIGQTIQTYTPSITSSAYIYPSPYFITLGGKPYYSWVNYSQSFPTNGYYIVNLNAYAPLGTIVNLWHYGPTGWVAIKTFTASTGGVQNFPHLEYYASGTHYFVYTVSSGYVYAYEVNLDSY